MTRLDWSNAGASDLRIDVVGPLVSSHVPVVFLPGIGVGYDWSFYPYLVEQLAQQRPVLLPELMSPYSLSAERSHVARLLETLGAGKLPDGCDWPRGKVGLIGHGKGAALAVLLGAESLAVRGIVAYSAYCTFHRSGQDAAADTQADVAAHAAEFQLEVAARSLRCPIVFVHGEEDAVSGFQEAETLYHWVPKEFGSLVLLEKTGHSLGATHPFAGTGKELERSVRIAREFCARELD
jgi:pimeloyl-ACP methyl ester carboxylesterase